MKPKPQCQHCGAFANIDSGGCCVNCGAPRESETEPTVRKTVYTHIDSIEITITPPPRPTPPPTSKIVR